MKKILFALLFLSAIISVNAQSYTNWPTYVAPVASRFSAYVTLTATDAPSFLSLIGGSTNSGTGGNATNAILLLNGIGTNTTLVNAIQIGATNINMLGNNGSVTFPHGDSIREYGSDISPSDFTGIAIGKELGAPVFEYLCYLIGGASNDVAATALFPITGADIFGSVGSIIQTNSDWSTIVGGRRNASTGTNNGVGGGGSSDNLIWSPFGGFNQIIGSGNSISNAAGNIANSAAIGNNITISKSGSVVMGSGVATSDYASNQMTLSFENGVRLLGAASNSRIVISGAGTTAANGTYILDPGYLPILWFTNTLNPIYECNLNAPDSWQINQDGFGNLYTTTFFESSPSYGQIISTTQNVGDAPTPTMQFFISGGAVTISNSPSGLAIDSPVSIGTNFAGTNMLYVKGTASATIVNGTSDVQIGGQSVLSYIRNAQATVSSSYLVVTNATGPAANYNGTYNFTYGSGMVNPFPYVWNGFNNYPYYTNSNGYLIVPPGSIYGVYTNSTTNTLYGFGTNAYLMVTNLFNGANSNQFIAPSYAFSNLTGAYIPLLTSPTNNPIVNQIYTIALTSNLLSGNGSGLAVNSGISPSTVLTNDAQMESFIASRPSLSVREREHLRGAISDLLASGYRSKLIDFWPLYSSKGGIYGTNQASFMGQPWIGWNQAISGAYTNGEAVNNPPCTNILNLVSNLSGPWTLAIVLRTPQFVDANGAGGTPTTYRAPYWILRNTNFLDSISFNYASPLLDNIMTIIGTNVIAYGNNQFVSNCVSKPTTGGFDIEMQNQIYRRTELISFDGTNKFTYWYNGEPGMFSSSNLNTRVISTYVATNNFTNVLNQLCLGYNRSWATNYPSTGYGFAGNIDSVALFSGICETNAIDAAGNVSVSPMATTITRFLRWLEPSEKMVSFSGTSMMANKYSVGGILTNEIWMAYAFQHPEIPDIQLYARGGASVQTMTNQGSTGDRTLMFSIVVDYPVWRCTFNRYSCIPPFVTGIEMTDNGRNDNNLTPTAWMPLFNSFYYQIRTNGVRNEVRWIVEAVGSTNNGAMSVAAQNGMIAIADAMRTNNVITKYIRNDKYICSGGIVDMLNLALSTGAHFNGTDTGLGWYIQQQQAKTLDGFPFMPPPSGVFSSITNQYPTYSVSLGASPAFWTNNVNTTVNFYYGSGTAITDITKGNIAGTSLMSIPTSLTGGMVSLQPYEYIKITATTEPSAAYQPVP